MRNMTPLIAIISLLLTSLFLSFTTSLPNGNIKILSLILSGVQIGVYIVHGGGLNFDFIRKNLKIICIILTVTIAISIIIATATLISSIVSVADMVHFEIIVLASSICLVLVSLFSIIDNFAHENDYNSIGYENI